MKSNFDANANIVIFSFTCGFFFAMLLVAAAYIVIKVI